MPLSASVDAYNRNRLGEAQGLMRNGAVFDSKLIEWMPSGLCP